MSSARTCENHSGVALLWVCSKCSQRSCQVCIDESVDVFDPILTRCPSCRGRCLSLDEFERGVSVREEAPYVPASVRRNVLRIQNPPKRTDFQGTWGEELGASFAYPVRGDNWWFLLIGVLFYWLLDKIFSFASLFGTFLSLVFCGYFFSYLVTVIKTSVSGERTLPFWPDFSGELVRHLFMFVVPATFALGPGYAVTYWYPSTSSGFVLLGLGVFFFPMMLLSAVILNAPLAANPLLAAPAIARTFRPYCGVLLLFASALALWHWTTAVGRFFGVFGNFLVRYATFYTYVLSMHALGLFYGRFEKEVGWLQDDPQ